MGETIDQPVILITGASRGIGAATAKLAAQKGYAVVVNYFNNETAASEVVRTIIDDGGDAISVKGDISTEAEVKSLFASIDAKWGRLDALVNNAGMAGARGAIEDLDIANLRSVLAVNVEGTLICCREAIQRFTKNGGGIVNLSSGAATSGGGGGGIVPYAAAKASVEALTIGLARELAGQNIRVNAVRPGAINTDLNDFGANPEHEKRFAQTTPLGRVGEPEEVAEAILWLLSEQSAYVNGSILPVTGGR
jgi:NAD(P)-dependent dehydrogenase (short-subunit alcohol dehydrogenase family)